MTAKLSSMFLILSLVLFGCGTAKEETTAAPKEEKTATGSKEDEASENGTEAKEAEAAEAEEPAAEETEKSEEQPAEELTAEQVLEKSIAAYEDVKSFSSEMTVDQTVDDGQQEIKTDASMQIEQNMDPMLIHTVNTTKSAADGSEFSFESYVTKDNSYVSQNGGEWAVMATDPNNPMVRSEAQSNPAADLEGLQEVAGDIKVKEEDSEYIISIDEPKEEFLNLYGDMVNQITSSLGVDGASAELTDLKLSYSIDKETFLQNTTTVMMSMTVDVEGQTIALDQKVDGTFSKYNELNDLEVPEEVTDSAQPME
ncbi:DUF6612 family protein [Metabacillus sp. 84]|uniref:DUF6612 family protein n=1 Tax=Metabacillus sp. 84 TaxID=3404705 RepID=UPI003CED5EF8